MLDSNLITEIAANVKSLKDDILPPIAKDARSASDSSIQLKTLLEATNERVTKLEEEQNDQYEKLDKHSKTITATDKELAGLTRWKTWLASILIPLSLAALGFAGKAIYESATTKATITSNIAHTDEIIDEQQEEIESLKIIHVRDFQSLEQKIDNIPEDVIISTTKKHTDNITFDYIYPNLSKRSKKLLIKLLNEANSAITH
ncbi:MAG: hypothetical protein ACW98D_16850 [Promethearchaeota archaeon]|jgi:hypothetical protein